MRHIPLTQGKFSIIDDADYECIIKWKWQCDTDGYARRPALSKERIGGKKHNIRMHRFILNAPKDMQVDHINGNRLDNRRCNLRLCNSAENGKNREKVKNTSSKYIGVSWSKVRKKWVSYIRANDKFIYLGFYQSEIDAAEARNKAVLEQYGAFAKLNIIDAEGVKYAD